MNTLYITRSGRILVDESGTPHITESSREAISSLYLIKEETKIVFVKDEEKKEIIANPGDIVINFYEDKFPNKVLIISNQEWKENIEAYENYLQDEKERWASSKTDSESISKPIK